MSATSARDTSPPADCVLLHYSAGLRLHHLTRHYQNTTPRGRDPEPVIFRGGYVQNGVWDQPRRAGDPVQPAAGQESVCGHEPARRRRRTPDVFNLPENAVEDVADYKHD